MLKKNTAIVLILFLSFLLSGCDKNFFPPRSEIDQIDVITVVGTDISEDDLALVEVTFLSSSQRKAAHEGTGGGQVITVVSSTGETVFDAKRKLKTHSDKVTLLGHTDYFIFGEDAAKDDFVKYFDCYTRDSEIRLTPKIYIAKGCTAKELMQTSSTGDKTLAERLKNLDYDVQLMSNFEQVELIGIADMLDNRNAATVIPALSLQSTEGEVYTGELPKNDVMTSGYAIIKDFKLVGFIDEPISRGYNFLTNNVMSANVMVKDSTGMNVELEVISSNATVEALFNGDTLDGVKYKVTVKSIIREQQSREDIYKEASLKSLETQLSQVISSEMQQVIDKSKEFETDAIRLGQQMMLKHPIKWENLKASWTDTFTNLHISVEVESQIRRSLTIEKPNGYQKGG